MTVFSQVSFFVRCHRHTNDSEMQQSAIELNEFVCVLITIIFHMSQANIEKLIEIAVLVIAISYALREIHNLIRIANNCTKETFLRLQEEG